MKTYQLNMTLPIWPRSAFNKKSHYPRLYRSLRIRSAFATQNRGKQGYIYIQQCPCTLYTHIYTSTSTPDHKLESFWWMFCAFSGLKIEKQRIFLLDFSYESKYGAILRYLFLVYNTIHTVTHNTHKSAHSISI